MTTTSPLITTHLRSALNQLSDNLALCLSDYARDPRLLPALRTATVKLFEFTYELSIKVMRRALEDQADSAEAVDQMDFRSLIRTAAERGLIRDPSTWFSFREQRNVTSHTYDQSKAAQIVSSLALFTEEVAYLLARLGAGHAPSI